MSSIKIVEKYTEPQILVRKIGCVKPGSVVGFVNDVKAGDTLSIKQAKKAMGNMVKGIVIQRKPNNQLEVFRFGDSFNDSTCYFDEDCLVIEFDYELNLKYKFYDVVETG